MSSRQSTKKLIRTTTGAEAEAERSLAEAAYESLLEGIIAGTFAPGAILSTLDLSKKLQISRTPVHDALRSLAADGFVELQTGRRARVVQFTRDDLWDIFELRRMLEGPAAELAAGRMDERHFAPLRQAAAELASGKKTPDWTRRWAEYDDLFHRVIAEQSGNRRLARDVNRYRQLHRTFNRIATDVKSLASAVAEHQAILAALEAHDGPRARRLMEQHIQNWQAYFVSNFPSYESSAP